MFPRAEIKEYAKVKFKDYYGNMLGVYVIYTVITGLAGSATAGIGSLLLTPPLLVGMSFFSYLVYQGERPEIGQLFNFGFDGFGRKLGGVLWSWLFEILWTLLLIVPGIVKAMAYSMVPYLLAEYPAIPATMATKVSMKITDGRKWDVFMMYLSFIGWILLACVTLGLSHLFYSGPYMQVALGGMYDVLKKDALTTGKITLSDLGVYPQAPGPDSQNPEPDPQNPGTSNSQQNHSSTERI